jgi:hypothetical protein
LESNALGFSTEHADTAFAVLSRSFIGHEPSKAVFIGLYEVGASRPLTYDQYWRIPEFVEMKNAFGMQGFSGDRPSILWFELELLDVYSEWKGKLIVGWPPPERSWWRWAARNVIPIHAILDESLLDGAMPDWQKIVLSWEQLQAIPSKWRHKLSEWRGIYYIHDRSDGIGYVGAAYGSENILGRWQNYSDSGHGGNAQLRKRSPHSFHFGILQRVSPDMEAQEIVVLENTWKDRLHTRTSGLNDN